MTLNFLTKHDVKREQKTDIIKAYFEKVKFASANQAAWDLYDQIHLPTEEISRFLQGLPFIVFHEWEGKYCMKETEENDR